MSFDTALPALHAELFAEFGRAGVLTTREGDDKPLQAILDEITHNVGDLGGQTDPRPSVSLLVSEAGLRPKGQLQIGARRFELERNVDAENDAYVVRVYVRELPV